MTRQGEERVQLGRPLDEDEVRVELLERAEHRPGRPRAVVPDAEDLDSRPRTTGHRCRANTPAHDSSRLAR